MTTRLHHFLNEIPTRVTYFNVFNKVDEAVDSLR